MQGDRMEPAYYLKKDCRDEGTYKKVLWQRHCIPHRVIAKRNAGQNKEREMTQRLKLTVALNLEKMSKEEIIDMIIQEAENGFHMGRIQKRGDLPFDHHDYIKSVKEKYYEVSKGDIES
jgi:hypothetical protein